LCLDKKEKGTGIKPMPSPGGLPQITPRVLSKFQNLDLL